MTMHVEFPNNLPGCNCGAYWSVVPPPPCPYHAFQMGPVPTAPLVPYNPNLSPKDLAALYRRLADALDPPVTTDTTNVPNP